MRENRTKCMTFLIAGILLYGTSQAQTSINTSGGDVTGSDGTIAYSIGQVFYTPDEGISGTIKKGVQQAYEIYALSTDENLTFSIEFSVYPNPTTNLLTLKVDGLKNENLSFQLYDMQGKLLNSNQITENETHINMEHLARANYFLRITNEKKEELKSFKIIKN